MFNLTQKESNIFLAVYTKGVKGWGQWVNRFGLEKTWQDSRLPAGVDRGRNKIMDRYLLNHDT